MQMTFTIRYNKTGKEIEISNKRAYLIFGHNKELEPLGFKAKDVWDKEGEKRIERLKL